MSKVRADNSGICFFQYPCVRRLASKRRRGGLSEFRQTGLNQTRIGETAIYALSYVQFISAQVNNISGGDGGGWFQSCTDWKRWRGLISPPFRITQENHVNEIFNTMCYFPQQIEHIQSIQQSHMGWIEGNLAGKEVRTIGKSAIMQQGEKNHLKVDQQ